MPKCCPDPPEVHRSLPFLVLPRAGLKPIFWTANPTIGTYTWISRAFWGIGRPYPFSASLIKGRNRSSGNGKTVVVLFSADISRMVCR
jgi:hypothetical protein